MLQPLPPTSALVAGARAEAKVVVPIATGDHDPAGDARRIGRRSPTPLAGAARFWAELALAWSGGEYAVVRVGGARPIRLVRPLARGDGRCVGRARAGAGS